MGIYRDFHIFWFLCLVLIKARNPRWVFHEEGDPLLTPEDHHHKGEVGVVVVGYRHTRLRPQEPGEESRGNRGPR